MLQPCATDSRLWRLGGPGRRCAPNLAMKAENIRYFQLRGVHARLSFALLWLRPVLTRFLSPARSEYRYLPKSAW